MSSFIIIIIITNNDIDISIICPELVECINVKTRKGKGNRLIVVMVSSSPLGGRVERILMASALSSVRAICPERVRRRHDWTIAVGLGCPDQDKQKQNHYRNTHYTGHNIKTIKYPVYG